ncbi:MAG: hypothetical protein E7314_06365 [Clostridiales bacterium]|nr:hypothetical protein [Clostridiales bacterium]
MMYIFFTVSIIMSIFNILLISNDNLAKERKEKVLLITYSISELLFLFLVVNYIEFTAVNLIIVLAFVCVWLLSKACICIINMEFEPIKEESVILENNNLEKNYTTEKVEEGIEENITETILEIEENKPEIITEIEENETESITEVEEKNESVEIVENVKEDILTPTSFRDLSDIIENTKINKEEETRMRRRSLALKISRIHGDAS